MKFADGAYQIEREKSGDDNEKEPNNFMPKSVDGTEEGRDHMPEKEAALRHNLLLHHTRILSDPFVHRGI